MRFTTGSVFGNRYVLGDRIAVGGMGEVWRATDQVLGRPVAIKLLSPSLAGQPGFAQRFREEARNTAALSHGNIAALYDYGEDDGASWLVMELVEGEPLSQIIKDEAPLDPARVTSIMGQAANALQAAHDAGVIHRDVKPANILVRHDGVVKLTDFGIARAVDAVPITRTGEVMGTAQYISPEQAMGHHVGPASDVYALGAVAHEMLTGRRAFDEGSPVATAMAHIHNPAPPLPPHVPQPLAGVVMACLAKDPSLRPASARDVALALQGHPMSSTATATQRLGSPARTERLSPRRPAPAPTGRPAATSAMRFEEPAEKRRTNPLVWLVPLLLVLAVALFAVLRFGPGSGPSTPVPTTTRTVTTAPTSGATSPAYAEVVAEEFVGRPYDAVSQSLFQRGLQAKRHDVYDASVPSGSVTKVSPTGSEIPKGSVIDVYVSKGPSPSPTPSRTTPTTSAPTQEPSASSEPPAPSEEPTQPQEQPTNGAATGGSAGNQAPVHPVPTDAPTAQPTGDAGGDAAGADAGTGETDKGEKS